MLAELRIQNFAIIDRLDLKLGAGLTILTGETGAGKSIILDAVTMLIGGRADASVIRAEADAAFVEGTYALAGSAKEAVNEILKREELDDDPNHVTLTREVRREGRSIARLNGRTVSLSLLREVGAHLVDIHGQSEHLSLLDPRAHLGLLDRFADVTPLLAEYRKTYRALLDLRRELTDLRAAQADAARRVEMLTFQAEEIEAAKLKKGEDEELRRERDRLANAESLAQHAQEALAVLDESTPEASAASDLMGQAVQALSALAKTDPSKKELAERMDILSENLADLSRELRDYLEEIEFNPKRLDEVEERLNLVFQLTRKYGGSIEAVNKFGAKARAQLETISTAEERVEELSAAEAKLLEKLSAQALKLSEKRRQAAETMSRGIETELDDLKMTAARFGVDFQTRPDPNGIPLADGTRAAFDQNGFDRVEFLVAPNPGEGLKPLAKIASGGETSRLMLGLKNVLARADEIPSLIFDEIDQGIGGRVGLVVGYKLWRLARNHQVFCVTHLPQLAAFGDQHYQVQKLVEKNRTLTRVEKVDGDARLLELSQMLGEVGEGTLRSAHEILQTARQMTKESKK
ncbi:MAG: DNA repair protein RecN [Anaerolineaceae bacterium]|nr:DNA repair protein RecN [Anaerolineae bacterium]MBL1172440.1 DNA repair protein RecN [Chloroflexota bacterium]MDL1925657.1 DNA repair protein RecN [Anaerolineae bacterium AMX1]WKZ54540.1 MAG: DNA repair protein RecN [Anaerolineales bacterium]GJQ39079.1 MAG: DNA repair protein RecN [Anaerolineaceae bacterium]